MSTQKQKATSGRREVARSRMHTLSVLGGAGSVALAGMAAGAAAQAYPPTSLPHARRPWGLPLRYPHRSSAR